MLDIWWCMGGLSLLELWLDLNGLGWRFGWAWRLGCGGDFVGLEIWLGWVRDLFGLEI